ncbi:hypothetical protein ABID22_000613 [Pontibacter aydingkolensis]|uniref:LamG domain-containing protein n=1 Tax=Pontibacter aydingkolensis TaxID=1911536 RepID=A0ABS7CRQ6_9BACT|nr:LamG domain-containing protein [Pontibacter aydingkolensis]MBW7466510.1 LamG domain-containing protein [Pontibacter aydingkolensis]
MTYQKYKSILGLLAFLFFLCGTSHAQQKTEVWQLKSRKKVGKYKAAILGNPKIVKADGGKAIAFNGREDGLLVNANPIAGATAFSIEVKFKPYAAYPENIEQRFLHIQDPGNPNRRILIELRLNDKQQWYADFFMRTDSTALTLIDSAKTHPVNEWATITLTYKDGMMKGFVNGVEEVSGEIEYMPIAPSAKTSLGTRMDKRSWFKGEIRSVSFSREVK